MTYTYKRALKESTDYFSDELSASIFVTKYALKDKQKRLLELTPTDMHRRIARELARVEQKKFDTDALTEDEIFEYIDHFKHIIPQGSPMFGIGNPNFVTLSKQEKGRVRNRHFPLTAEPYTYTKFIQYQYGHGLLC
jgi:hypothetical protein